MRRAAVAAQNIPITKPRLYAPKCLPVYNGVVICGASQMLRIICIVIPSARPRDLYCAAWRDRAMRLTRIWLFSLCIRNAWIVTASWRILKNRASSLNPENVESVFRSHCNCYRIWKEFHFDQSLACDAYTRNNFSAESISRRIFILLSVNCVAKWQIIDYPFV